MKILYLFIIAFLLTACAVKQTPRVTARRGASATHGASLAWMDTQNPPGDTFNIYRYEGRCWSNKYLYTNIANVSAPNYQDFSVVSGHSYCFFVTALSNNIESGPSNKVRVKIP